MELKKRIEGAILGAIIGDCVANPYLFMKAEALQKERNDIGWEIHDMSDESQLLILGLETIHARGIQYNSLIRAYQTWVHTRPSDVDHIMCQVFGHSGKLRSGLLWNQAIENDVGNLNSASLLVRQIPIVLSLWRTKDESKLLETIDNVTRLTHADERTREICRMYALTLAMLLRGASRLNIWDALQAKIRFSSTHTCIVNSYYYPPCLDSIDYSANHVTFQRVLYDLWHSNNFVSSIRSCILSGGGTDMNASALGAILGALWGRDGLPMPWVDELYGKYDAYIDHILKEARRIARHAKTDSPHLKPKPIPCKTLKTKRHTLSSTSSTHLPSIESPRTSKSIHAIPHPCTSASTFSMPNHTIS